MYEALLAFLYAQGSRYGAHDLAEFLVAVPRVADGARARAPPEPMLEADAGPSAAPSARPVEVPSSRAGVERAASPAARAIAAIDRAAEMGERRDVTGAGHRASARRFAGGGRAGRQHRRTLGRARPASGGRAHRRRSSASDDPDGRDTEMATRCALVALRSLDASRRPGAGRPHRAHPRRRPRASPPTTTAWARCSTPRATSLACAKGSAAMSTQAMRQVQARSSSSNPMSRRATAPPRTCPACS